MDTAKRVGGGAVVVLLGYIIVMPMFWGAMPPSVAVNLPESWPHDQDLPLQLEVSAMHANYAVTLIRFYVDNNASTMEGVEGPFYVMPLLQQPSKNFSLMNPFRRLTYATGETVAVTVPLAQQAQEKLTGPGTLTGFLDIQIDHPGSQHRHKNIAHDAQAEQANTRIPFTIRLE